MAALQAMRDHDISQHRVCQLVGVDPKAVRRERPPDCPELRKAMREIAGQRRRFGILLEREGMIMNHKNLYRIYREDELSVRRRRGRKWVRGTKIPMPEATHPNARWSLDPRHVTRINGVPWLDVGQLRCRAQVPYPDRDRFRYRE